MKSHLKKERLSLSYIVYHGEDMSASSKKKALGFLEELNVWTAKQGFKPDRVTYHVELGMIMASYDKK